MTYNAVLLCSLLGKIHEADEKRSNSPGSLQQDAESGVSGDAYDFTDEGQEVAWESTTLGLQSNPRHLQCRIWRHHFALKLKAAISNHTSDRLRELGNLYAICRFLLWIFVRSRYCSVTELTITHFFFLVMQKHLSGILVHAKVCDVPISYPQDTKSFRSHIKFGIQDFRQILQPRYPHTLWSDFDSCSVLSGTRKAQGRPEMPKLKKSATCSRFCKIKVDKKIPERKEEGRRIKKFRDQLSQMHREVQIDFPVTSCPQALCLYLFIPCMAAVNLHSHGDYFIRRQYDPSEVPKQNPAETRREVDVKFRVSASVFTGGLLQFITLEMQYACY